MVDYKRLMVFSGPPLADVLARAMVKSIEISPHAPAYYSKRLEHINEVVNSIIAIIGYDEDDEKTFRDGVEMQLNENRVWKRISEYLKLPEAIEKYLDYHAIYDAMRKGYMNARKDEEGWLIEEVSFHAWLRAFPYGSYGGNG